jgi:4-nitrophenyl phosphatase
MPIDYKSLRAVILDMDGVLWRDSEVLPGVADFFAFLQRHGIGFALATNNSSKTVESYVERLNAIGVPAGPGQIITSSVATAAYVRRHYPVDTPIYIIGLDGIRQALGSLGYREDPQRARLVVVGIDFGCTYEMLKIATLRIREGAEFIGTNGDRSFPSPEGLIPGNGALLAAIQTATDKTPVVIGKPEAAMFEVALDHLGTRAAETLMIGDRLDTDILGAQQAGLITGLVLTGITTVDEVASSPIQADGVFRSLADLHQVWASQLKVAV